MADKATLEFMNAVADAVEAEVISKQTPGRWRAGPSGAVHEWSTLRAMPPGEDRPCHIGTAISKADQRAMMAAQPSVLLSVIAVIRAVDEYTPEPLASSVYDLCQWYDKTMALKIANPAGNHRR